MPDEFWTGVIAIREYHPYWLPGRARNPAFTAQDGLILDVKDNIDRGIPPAVRDFLTALEAVDELPDEGVRLAVVPGHEARAANRGRGLARVVEGVVAARTGRFIDSSDTLVRHRTIDKLAHGGDRDEQVHLTSIRVAEAVEGLTVVVIDDVTTTGGTLSACRKLLLAAGAAAVGAMVLGKTTH